jgi:hypothetical protein
MIHHTQYSEFIVTFTELARELSVVSRVKAWLPTEDIMYNNTKTKLYVVALWVRLKVAQTV